MKRALTFAVRFSFGFALGLFTIAFLLAVMFLLAGCASDVFSRLR